MRISSLVTVVMLLSSAAFAQHSSTNSAPSSPPPNAAPSSPPPASAPSASASASSSGASSAASASVSHSSAPISPSPVTTPESHVAPMPSTSGSHASGPPSDWNAGKAVSPARSSDSIAGRVVPGEKLSGNEDRIVASPRIGETQPTREKDGKTPESDLRRRICPNGPCKEPQPKTVEADFRRVCKDGSCVKCPPGQSPGKKGTCVASDTPTDTASTSCPPNEFWNGGSCVDVPRCQPGESWNGTACVDNGQCASFSSRASLLTAEAVGLRSDMEAACAKDPRGQECIRLTQSHDGVVQRYGMLLNEAPGNCRTTLPDPLSL